MATNSSIEWTEKTWNPVLGCSIISPGCHHCYAMAMARRLKGVALARLARGEDPGRLRYYAEVIGEDGRWNGRLVLVPEALHDPRRWKRAAVIFTNSMSDLFHEHLPVSDIRQVCEAMARASHHTYQVLTKRAERMADLLTGELREYAELAHIWWGVSVENRRHGLPRVEHLRRVPAGGVRFLSVEPLLEDLGELSLEEIHWVIAGAESGPCARPMDEQWVRPLRDACQAAEVPFFYKQKAEGGRKVPLPVLDGRVCGRRCRSRCVAAWTRPPSQGRAITTSNERAPNGTRLAVAGVMPSIVGDLILL
jgi:protein gp37